MGDDKFEDYTKLKILGEGAFGKAFLVEHKLTKFILVQFIRTQWVMKQLDISAMPEKEKEVTIKEAKILQILNHPNIVQFKDVYITKKSKLCIVMEYADGGDLSMRIKGQKGQLFPENQILDWFTQICLALKHVHDRKILHRDLKGQNIFLTKKNHIKLGDFGIARVLGSTLDKARTQVGTPYYLSPEIIESKPYSYSSDIWSLGAILYEMCTLKPPFDADSLHFLALKILKGQYAPISSVYSKDLKNLIQSMMQLQSVKRPNINQILKLPLITKRIQEFLTESVQKVEFAHTILHKQKIDIRCQLKDIKVIEEGLPCPPQLLLQKQLSVPVIQNQQPQQVKSPQVNPVEQNQKQKLQQPPQLQNQPQSQQNLQQQRQQPSHQQNKIQPHPTPPPASQQKVNQYPVKQAQPIKNIQPQKQMGPPQQIQKKEVAKPTTAQNFNKRSNSRNKVSEQEIKQKQEQERIKFQQIKQEADQKRKDAEKKKLQQQQIHDEQQKRQREENLKKQQQKSEEMRLDIKQKRKLLYQNQSLQEQLGNENSNQQQPQQLSQQQLQQQQEEDFEEYNSEEEQEIKKEINNQDIQETADKENSSDMDYGIQCENQQIDKDDLTEAKMLLDLEDLLKDVAEVNNKVNELDYNNFEKQRIQILQNDLIAAVNDDDFEDSDFSLTITQNVQELQQQNEAGLNYFGDPDRVNQLKAYLISGLGQQNVDQALKILKNELLQKTIEEVEQENTKNYYQSLLPFLSVQQTKKYIVELFQLVVFMDQSMS